MKNLYSTTTKHCRWCSRRYTATQPHDRDGFCSTAHKQAHHRAYLKYVTAAARSGSAEATSAVTQKSKKKKKR